MRSKVALLAVVALAAASGPAAAQSVRLGMEEAVDRMLARHPAVKASDFSVDEAEARVAEARTAWLPRLTVEGLYRFAGPLAELSLPVTIPGVEVPPVEVGSLNNVSATLKAGWRAWDTGARGARIDAAREAARAARAEGAERAADLAYAVRAAYLAALLAGEVVTVTERSLETARQELGEEKARRQAGIGEDVSVAAVESRVADLEARLVDAREGRKRAEDDLRIFLGLPAGAPVAFADGLDQLAVLGEGEAQSPTLQRLEALAAATSLERTAVGRAQLPTINLFASFGVQHPETFIDDGGWGPSYAAGVLLSWDVFDGDLRRRQRRELDARRSALRALRDAAAEDITRKDTEASSRAESAVAAIAAANRAVEVAAVYQRAAGAALKAGTGTSLEVRKADEALDRAHLALAKARFDAALARANRLRARGVAAVGEEQQPSLEPERGGTRPGPPGGPDKEAASPQSIRPPASCSEATCRAERRREAVQQ